MDPPVNMMMTRDTLPDLRQDRSPQIQGLAHFMPSPKSHARWSDAIRSTVALWLFVALVFLPRIIALHAGESWTSVALDCVTFIVSMILAMIMFVFSRATIGMPHRSRLPLLAAAVLFFAALNVILDALYSRLIADNFVEAWRNLPADFGRRYNSLLNYILVFGVNMILFHVSYARREGVQQERQLAEANLAAQQAQLAALRYQLNPHFLFNTLNSISTLVLLKQTERANAMLSRLSSFLRYTLVNESTGTVTLTQEIETLKLYLEIEKMRFEDRLRPHFHIDRHAMAAQLPSLLLQPLIENAIKYAVTPQEEGADISVEARRQADRVLITVSDTGPGTDALYNVRAEQSTGVGLANIRDRLAQAYGDNHRFETQSDITGGFRVFIDIPYQYETETEDPK